MKLIKVENEQLFIKLAEEYGLIQSECDYCGLYAGDEEFRFVVVMPEIEMEDNNND